ncbi:hypothetical protein L2E82_11302 [Cichorium intybus]|uniref:Uncharacterized protein n=1 Tax=Cichorium intybus TaxID=13427 RepID=A0ACB9GE14_CICIN|nr:hypothetical protein L2E82_11302 [Cichorium intybus]
MLKESGEARSVRTVGLIPVSAEPMVVLMRLKKKKELRRDGEDLSGVHYVIENEIKPVTFLLLAPPRSGASIISRCLESVTEREIERAFVNQRWFTTSNKAYSNDERSRNHTSVQGNGTQHGDRAGLPLSGKKKSLDGEESTAG